MSDLDAEERELKMAQIRADIANKDADTRYKQTVTRTEFPKVVVALLAATAALFGTLFGIFGFILGRGH